MMTVRCGWGVLVTSSTLASTGVIAVVKHIGLVGDAISYQSALLAMMVSSLFFLSYFKNWKERTDQLVNSERALSKASNLLLINEMGATLAHEINTPLQAALFLSQKVKRILKKDDADWTRQIEDLENVKHAIENVGQIINRVRNASKSSIDEPIKANISQVVDASLVFVYSEIRKNMIDVEVNELSSMPDVAIRHSEAIQIFTNIIKNSCDALAVGDKRKISIKAAKDNQFVTISICDSGIGLDQAAQEKLFQLGASSKENGLGIGMWLCKSIAVRCGGDLVYEQEHNTGACFKVRLPVYE